MVEERNEVQLLEQFLQQRAPELREALILRYIPLVHFVLGRLGLSPGASMDYEDVVSSGLLGLIDAVDRFNPSFGAQFSTYATVRIRGQVLDHLRSKDWLSRSARQRARALQNAMIELLTRLERTPSEAELVEYMKIDLDKLHQAMLDSSHMIISIDAELQNEEGESSLYEILTDEKQIDPSDMILDMDLKSELVKALSKISEREQMILSLYYNDNLTMREIGEILGVSESRVCQLHGRAVMTLRAIMVSQDEVVMHQKTRKKSNSDADSEISPGPDVHANRVNNTIHAGARR